MIEDTLYSGNALRFVNHSDSPNTEMRRIFLDGCVRTLYVAIKDIACDEQISVSYGFSYWKSRSKQKVQIVDLHAWYQEIYGDNLMEFSMLVAMFTFSLTMSITPGPVNMVILFSGINYGVRRTLPYVLGATIGFTLLLLCVGLFLYQVIHAYPDFLTYLACVGSVYIAYIGYKIAASKPELINNVKKIPRFHQGFILQWINPKAWIACVSGVSLFSHADRLSPFLIFLAIYCVVCYLSLGLWAVVGQRLSGLLKKPSWLRAFNMAMGGLLIVTSAYLGYSHLVYSYG